MKQDGVAVQACTHSLRLRISEPSAIAVVVLEVTVAVSVSMADVMSLLCIMSGWGCVRGAVPGGTDGDGDGDGGGGGDGDCGGDLYAGGDVNANTGADAEGGCDGDGDGDGDFDAVADMFGDTFVPAFASGTYGCSGWPRMDSDLIGLDSVSKCMHTLAETSKPLAQQI